MRPARPARLYLAGPDVFHRDALALGAAKKTLCERHGFVGLYPLDGGEAGATSAAIYAACLAMMDAADGGIFNLTPFRGPSADVGTVFELGAMVAAGKPVFAYTDSPKSLIDRLRSHGKLTLADGVWRDASGLMVEDFGNADNLMIDEALARQGRKIHRGEAGGRNPLGGFEACLIEAERAFTPP